MMLRCRMSATASRRCASWVSTITMAESTRKTSCMQSFCCGQTAITNGYSEAGELQAFSDLFEAIALGYTYAPRKDGFGNEYRYQRFVRRLGTTPEEAREIKVFDVFLAAQ